MQSYCYCAWSEKINENKIKRNINNDLAIVASQIPRGAIHDTSGHHDHKLLG